MMMTNTKLAQEQAVAQAVKAWYVDHSYGPSFRNLAQMTNLSLGTVYAVCQELREVGILEFEDGVARTVKIKETA